MASHVTKKILGWQSSQATAKVRQARKKYVVNKETKNKKKIRKMKNVIMLDAWNYLREETTFVVGVGCLAMDAKYIK